MSSFKYQKHFYKNKVKKIKKWKLAPSFECQEYFSKSIQEIALNSNCFTLSF